MKAGCRWALILGCLLFCGASSVEDSKTLLKEFTGAQRTEQKALEHRHRFEMKELKSAQDIRVKEFEKSEKEARYKFFQEHLKGPERRDYVKAFIKKREDLHKANSEDRTRKNKEYEEQLNALKKEHEQKLKDFKQALDKNEKPSQDLWPK